MKYESICAHESVKADTLYIGYDYAAWLKKDKRRKKRRVHRYEVRECHIGRFNHMALFTSNTGMWMYTWMFEPGTSREDMLQVAENLMALFKVDGS